MNIGFWAKYHNGEPCDHKGCLNHLSRPCEGCGRINGQGTVWEEDKISEINLTSEKQEKLLEYFDEWIKNLK